jgi:SAM-dependent methyltransferase
MRHQVPPYRLPARIEQFFQEFVNKPFENHERSKAWVREVVNQDWRYHSQTLLEQGRTSFLQERNGLTPRDQILIYCYRYMQMHTASGFHLFLRGLKDHKLKFLTNPVFVDFGCGPLTSAVSLAWYNLAVNRNAERDGLLLHYIGIDRSTAMLCHAQEATKIGELFHKKSTFDFVTRMDAPKVVPQLIDKYRSSSRTKELTIILNCSYYFGSHSLNVTNLVSFITELLRKSVPDDPVCLSFQNPWFGGVNEKWEQFKVGMKGMLSVVSSVNETVEYHDVTGRRHQGNPHRIRLRRELLLNRTWKRRL